MNNEQIINKLYKLALVLNRPVNKSDINLKNGFSFHYTTLVNKGIYLKNLNFKEYIYNFNPKLCEQCEIPLLYSKKNNKYCSKSCAAKINNKLFPKKISKSLDKKCPYCLKFIKKRKNYCSMKCRNDMLYMNNFLEWYYNDGNFKGEHLLIKNFITIIHGYKCFECGISEYNNKKLTLHLEHINGNANDNAKENLSMLCPNCHGQTPTYKGRNKGNGTRIWRNERYRQGKSY